MSEESTLTAPTPEAAPAPDVDPVIKFGQELQKAPGFSASLDKAKSDREKSEGTTDASPKNAPASKPDPIAAKNDQAKKEAGTKPEEKKSMLGKRSSSLLEDPKPATKEEADPEKPELKVDPKKSKSEASDDVVTDEDISEELQNPHKSEKANKRFRELYRRMKEAEGKSATTAKQIQEKDARVAELQKQLDEASKKASTPDPDTQKKLEEYQMLRRQHDLENDPKVKDTYDRRITASEDAIGQIFQSNRIEFKGMDSKQSYEVIVKDGGFRGFMRKYPDLAQEILDTLNVADNQEVQAAISSQIMLEGEKKNYISTEKAKAKEYFEQQAKEQQEAAANAPTPEKLKAAHQAKLETVKKQIIDAANIFHDQEIPADASDEERTRLTEENAFANELRETLASHLDPHNDDEFVDTAVAATLATKFKREKVALAAKVEKLEKEIERIKNAGRTTPRGGALPPTIAPKDFNKPAPSFGAAIDLVQRNRG